MFNRALRDALLAVLLCAALVSYGHYLNVYLQEVGNPWILVYGFWLSLGFAIWREWQPRYARLSFARVCATAIMFCIGVLLAIYLRSAYVGLLKFELGQPEFVLFVGADVENAMKNRVVGFGGCYALALMLLRMTLHKLILRMCLAGFVPADCMPKACQHCGQNIMAH